MTPKQRTLPVPIVLQSGERDAIVRRFYWKDHLAFADALVAHVAAVYGFRAELGAALKTGSLDALFAGMPKLILGSDALVKQLLTATTDLTREQVDQLETLSLLDLVGASLNLNYDDEIKNSFAGVVGRLLGAIGFQPTNSGASVTSTSSTPASPPTTSTAAPSSTSTSSPAAPTS